MREFLMGFYWDVMPVVLQLIAAVLGAVLLRAANTARDRWGIEIEARHREALHSALMSGIRAALGRGLTGKTAIDAAISYATISVPDAVVALNPARDVLTDLASSKLREALEKTPILDFGGDRVIPSRDPA